MSNRSSNSLQYRRMRRQRGAAMLFAIVIIVVASLLGAAMVRMLRLEQSGVAMDVLSTRALLAADSAGQQAMFQLFDGSVTAAARADRCKNNIDGLSITFSVTGLGGCSAVTRCKPYTATASSNYYSIISTGTCGPANDTASRQVEVLARDI